MANFQRTHTCGQLRASDIGKQIRLSGWVHRRRDHGGLIFIDLRDKFGLTQIVFDPEINKATHEAADKIRSEWVLSISGKVIPRKEGMINPKLPTGEIEIEVQELNILSIAKTPPFSICDEFIEVNEELRLKYRYLDIRRGDVIKKLHMRHKAMLVTRNFLADQQFIEVSTPILCRSTPEGARDYLVPSRIYPGQFFALPQSPQMFKQLLMISGMDRYFQIATCFRDEDLRADRQPEFSQIDIEMSFENSDTLFRIIESLFQSIFKNCLNIDIPTTFKRMNYKDCIENYGTDKPDLRFHMPLIRMDDIAKRSTFSIFLEQVNLSGHCIKGICVKGGADISRKGIEEYTSFVGQFGVKGLAWMKKTDGKLNSSIVKFFDSTLQEEMINRFEIEEGDLLLMVADHEVKTNQALDHLRRKIARDRNLIKTGQFEFLWVTDFPLFSFNAEENCYEAEHHPFTGVLEEDISLLDKDPTQARSLSYDLVLNGYELASGSTRIYDQKLQQKIFQILKLSDSEIKEKFGFFIESLQYGTPPHLGIAIGFDRLIMILTETDNIRDVIAFPKTQKATDLMMEAPSNVATEQLDILGLEISG